VKLLKKYYPIGEEKKKKEVQLTKAVAAIRALF